MDLLVEKYPDLFLENQNYMYGCGEGWVNRIVAPLCQFIQHAQRRCSTHRWKFHQVKEKFGTLCLYGGFDVIDEKDTIMWQQRMEISEKVMSEIRGAISFSECLSIFTCEATGDVGHTCTVGNWIKTYSKEQIEKHSAKKMPEKYEHRTNTI